jgi:hypothetical protein
MSTAEANQQNEIATSVFTTTFGQNSTQLNNTRSGLSEADSGSMFRAYLVIGCLGTVGNAFILVTLCFTKLARRNTVNMFIANQTSLDMVACRLVQIQVSTNCRRFGDVHSCQNFHSSLMPSIHTWPSTCFTARSSGQGLAMCILFASATLSSTCSNGSVLSLVIITLERYFKIVHPVLHRTLFRGWMVRVGVALPWLYPALALRGLQLPAAQYRHDAHQVRLVSTRDLLAQRQHGQGMMFELF